MAVFVAVQDPLDCTAMVLLAGLANPWVAVKARLFDERVKEPGESVSVTPTVLVVFPAVTEMVAVLVWVETFPRSTLAIIVPLPEPEVVLSLSQAALTLAVQLLFAVTLTDWLAGLEPPDTPV